MAKEAVSKAIINRETYSLGRGIESLIEGEDVFDV